MKCVHKTIQNHCEYFLVEFRNFKTQNIMQAKAAEENCERRMQEIIQRERECKTISEGMEREKIRTKEQLTELQETVHELQDRLDRTQNENKNLFEKLRDSEVEVETVKMLNQRLAHEANEKLSIIEKLEGQITYSEIKLKETEEQLKVTKDMLTENYTALKQTATKSEEDQEMPKDNEAKRGELEEKLVVTEKCIDDLRVMIQRKEQELNDKVSIIEIHQNQAMQSEEQLKQMRTQLVSTEEKFKESELALKTAMTQLEQTREKAKETETNLRDSEAELTVTEKGNDTLQSKGMLHFYMFYGSFLFMTKNYQFSECRCQMSQLHLICNTEIGLWGICLEQSMKKYG